MQDPLLKRGISWKAPKLVDLIGFPRANCKGYSLAKLKFFIPSVANSSLISVAFSGSGASNMVIIIGKPCSPAKSACPS